MEKITSLKDLRASIQVLEADREEKFKILQTQFEVVVESLKPINVIKDSIKQAVVSKEIQGNLIDGLIGLAAGHLSKKIVIGKSVNPIKNIAGYLIELAVASLVSKNTEGIKSKGLDLLKSLLTGLANRSK